jgi:hypothetical protein
VQALAWPAALIFHIVIQRNKKTPAQRRGSFFGFAKGLVAVAISAVAAIAASAAETTASAATTTTAASVAAAAAAAAAATEAASSTTAAATTTAFFTGACFVDGEGSALAVSAVESRDCGLCLLVRGHFHESETLAPASVPIIDDLSGHHLAMSAKHLFQF